MIRRRSEFRRAKALERLHLVEGLLLALVDIDEVIQVIRSSEDAETAKTRLMQVFDLDEVQAQYILDLRLRRLTKMSRIELEAERDDLRRRIEELEAILASADSLDAVVIREMDDAVAAYGSPRRTVLLDENEDGSLTPVKTHGDDSLADFAQSAALNAAKVSDAAADVAAAKKASDAGMAQALQIEDEPCVIALSATGLIGRMDPKAADAWSSRDPAAVQSGNDVIVSMIHASTRATYGLVTSAGRFVLAHAVELPSIAVTEPLSLAGGIDAAELVVSTEHTEPVDGERVIAAVAIPGKGEPLPLALGTRHGVVKRWNRESPTTMDSWSIIDLKDGDELLTAREAADGDRVVFVSSDSSLLTFDAKLVRPQGRTAAGMAGIRLAEGCTVLTCAIVPAAQVAWHEAQTDDQGAVTEAAHGAVVLTVAGDADALPGTENGSAKLTPFSLYPTKGRATGGVRSQRFLKGQNTLVKAYVGDYPLVACTEHGHPVALPQPDMRRDGSGTELTAPITYVA